MSTTPATATEKIQYVADIGPYKNQGPHALASGLEGKALRAAFARAVGVNVAIVTNVRPYTPPS